MRKLGGLRLWDEGRLSGAGVGKLTDRRWDGN